MEDQLSAVQRQAVVRLWGTSREADFKSVDCVLKELGVDDVTSLRDRGFIEATTNPHCPDSHGYFPTSKLLSSL